MSEQPQGKPENLKKARPESNWSNQNPPSGLGMDSIWTLGQTTEHQKSKKKPRQVTDFDIVDDPEKNQNNPRLQIDGEILNNIWLRNMGYQPGSFETTSIPTGGEIRFLSKPTYDHEHKVHNWYVQGLDPTGKSLGNGTISTWNQKGAIITTKEGRQLIIFRPLLIVRR